MLRERIFDDEKPRLNRSEKLRYKSQLNGRSEISGVLMTQKDNPNIHHIQPVAYGGEKTQENLATVTEAEHAQIHSIATKLHTVQMSVKKQKPDLYNWIVDRYGYTIGEKVGNITLLCMEEGKLSRVHQGENARGVYRRELIIDKVRKETELLQEQNGAELEG